MKQKLSALLLSVLLTLVSINCGKKDISKLDDTGDYSKIAAVDTTGAVTGDWIIQRELADPQSLNPITLQDATGRELSLHVFERLLWAAGRESYDLEPWIALGPPEETPDHLNYTYKLMTELN